MPKEDRIVDEQTGRRKNTPWRIMMELLSGSRIFRVSVAVVMYNMQMRKKERAISDSSEFTLNSMFGFLMALV